MDQHRSSPPIGIFDSGVGGLTVAKAAVELMPTESIHYFGDTAWVPYGARSAAWINERSHEIVDYLLQAGVKAILVACNTASAAALDNLRDHYPQLPIVGMEPAVKPGAKATRSGTIGILATRGTFASARYQALADRYARGVRVLEDPCIGLVEQIEAGHLTAPATRALLEEIILPMIDQGADTLVLGCTHYPFVRPLIEAVVDGRMVIIDPSAAVARQLCLMLEEHELSASDTASPHYHLEFSGERPTWLSAAWLTSGVIAAPD